MRFDFAANLSWLYQELAFEDRFAAAARDGFKAIEILFPYEHKAARVAALLREHDLICALINAPPGDWARGERGLAALSGREADFRASMDEAVAYAKAINCARVHVMSGLADESSSELWIANLREAAKTGIALSVEPLNAHDVPGYFLRDTAQALNLIESVGAANLGLQFDLYHAGHTEADIAVALRNAIDRITHVQIAGLPDRHEPEQFDQLVLLDELGFDGWVGCEYKPRDGTTEGLNWLKRLRAR
ncbi:hydroxypyruvate isomerase family protein [Burkholderiaceae bacterium UC74_6]